MLLFLMVPVVIDVFLLQTWSVHVHQHYIKIIIDTTST